MARVKRALVPGVATAGVVLAGLYVVAIPALAQRGGGNSTQATTPAQTAKPPVKIAGDFDKVKVLEPSTSTEGTLRRTSMAVPPLAVVMFFVL